MRRPRADSVVHAWSGNLVHLVVAKVMLFEVLGLQDVLSDDRDVIEIPFR